ncbi:hypothetical protein [Singulisphaera sp. PoT]|uniref:hypothetical protein n=1 Tax=Singulisphaera sp. PoT TaxID=3411797 RepID=UPI003BF520B4
MTSDDATPPSDSPDDGSNRPMRLTHLMVIVAAVALTISLVPALFTWMRKPSSSFDYRSRAVYQTSLALILWTPSLALAAVISNRSRLRRIIMSYGYSAIFVATAAILFDIVRATSAGLASYYRGFPLFPYWPESIYIRASFRFVYEASVSVPPGVVAAWTILALTRTGRRPADWFDRFCLVFGILWVFWGVAGHDFMLFAPFDRW